MTYATVDDVKKRYKASFDEAACETLLEDAAVMIDAYNKMASTDAKKVVSCRMVVRALGTNDVDVPIGATQGSMSALGYSQTWALSNGATGELYLGRGDKKLLGVGNKIGTHSPLEDM